MHFKNILFLFLLITPVAIKSAELNDSKQEADAAGSAPQSFAYWSQLPPEIQEKIASLTFDTHNLPPFDPCSAGEPVQLVHQNMSVFASNGANFSCIAFHPHRPEIAIVTSEHTLIWNTKTQELIHNLPKGGFAASYSPDGKQLATIADHIYIWDALNGNRLLTIPGSASHLAYSPNSELLATASLFGDTVTIVDTRTGRQTKTIPISDSKFISFLAYSPDSNTLSTGKKDGICYTWDVQSGKLLNSSHAEVPTPQAHERQVVAYSPDGTQVAYGSSRRPKTLSISTSDDASMASVDDPSTKEVLSKNDNSVTCLTFSPNGKNLLSGCTDYYASSEMWHRDSCSDPFTKSDRGLWHNFPKEGAANFRNKFDVASCAFSPSGEQVAILYRNKHLVVWGKKILDYVIGNFKPAKNCFQFRDKTTGNNYTKPVDPLKVRLLALDLATAIAEKKQIALTPEQMAYCHCLPAHIRPELKDAIKKPSQFTKCKRILRAGCNALLESDDNSHPEPQEGSASIADAQDAPELTGLQGQLDSLRSMQKMSDLSKTQRRELRKQIAELKNILKALQNGS